ncbi:MAG: DedA family protein [Pyrobaculum sp.]
MSNELVGWLGPLGVFLAVFISHLIPFVPLPGYLATVVYTTANRGLVEAILAIVATGLGAALGKIAVFLYGYGIGRAVMGEELAYARRFFQKVSKWGVDLAVFIFAVSPLADDVLYIPLGAAGYDIRRFFAAVLAGKMALASLIVLFTESLVYVFEPFASPIITTVLTALATIVLTALALRIRWSMVLAAYERGGLEAAVRAMLRSIAGKSL